MCRVLYCSSVITILESGGPKNWFLETYKSKWPLFLKKNGKKMTQNTSFPLKDWVWFTLLNWDLFWTTRNALRLGSILWKLFIHTHHKHYLPTFDDCQKNHGKKKGPTNISSSWTQIMLFLYTPHKCLCRSIFLH